MTVGGPTFLFILCYCGIALAQNPELGRVVRTGNEAKLIVEGPRPVDSASSTLASEFGIRVNVEDPAYIFRDDVKDAGMALWNKIHALEAAGSRELSIAKTKTEEAVMWAIKHLTT